MARKELTVTSYIIRNGERIPINSLPREERIKLVTNLTDRFMLSLGYVPENTKDADEQVHNKC